MAGIAGALLGLSNAFERDHQEQFETELAHRKSLGEMYTKMSLDPNIPPDAQQEYIRRAGVIYQTPYNKKLPTDVYKPYERQVPTQLNQGGVPQQPQTNDLSKLVVPPPAPGANVNLSAGGGGAPGVLQGGANQLPTPVPVSGPSPVPDSPAPAPPMSESLGMPASMTQMGVPQPPTLLTTQPPAAPNYTGPMTQSAPGVTYTPEEQAKQQAAALALQTAARDKAQVTSKYEAAISIGASPQQAMMIALGTTAMMKPKPVNAVLDDGSRVRAMEHYDPTISGYRYFDVSNGDDITARVKGTAISSASSGGMHIVKGGVEVNGKQYAASDPNIPPDALRFWNDHIAEVTKTTTKGSTTDAFGNTFSTSRTTPGSAAPPAPPSSSNSVKPSGGAVSSYVKQQAERVSQGQTTLDKIPLKGGLQKQVMAYMQNNGLSEPLNLTPAAQQVVMKTQPILQDMQMMKEAIEKAGWQNNNTPFTTLPQQAKYKLGIASDDPVGEMLSRFNLNEVVGGARLIAGASRSIQALQLAMQHTPDPTKDSPKLMYDKIKVIQANLQNVLNAAKLQRKGGTVEGSGVDAPPPPEIWNSVPEGGMATSPNGTSYKKVNGVPVKQ